MRRFVRQSVEAMTSASRRLRHIGATLHNVAAFPSTLQFIMSTSNEKVIYTGTTRVTGGRNGSATSSDGRLAVALSKFGSDGEGTNPEQLLGAGWSACFLSAIGKAAQVADVALPADAAVQTDIDLVQIGDAFQLAARLNVSLPGVDANQARALANRAHEICPYSKATRGNIDVQIHIVDI